MKNIAASIMGIILGLLLISTSVAHHFWKKEKAERQRLEINLEQYGRDVSDLTLTNREIKTELDKKNAAILKTDSILKSKNRKISQLENLIATTVSIVDTDTTYIPVDTKPVDKDSLDINSLDKNWQLYKSEFTTTKSCITISGFILSTDSVPSLAFTKREANIQVYDIRIRRKWYQFWRPREERIIETNCGEVEILTINKK